MKTLEAKVALFTRIFSILTCSYFIVFTAVTAYAEYTGGSDDGWSYTTSSSPMYLGGEGDGDNMAATTSDTAVAYGTATKLAFTTQPTDTARNAVITPAPVVQVQDADSNPVLSATNTITVAILSNPGSATLGGTISKTASSGSATFSDLTLNHKGTGYTLSASATELTSATSNSFNITNSLPTVSSITGSQTTDGSKNVTISYTATDANSDACNLTTAATQAQYSLDNVSWSNATISGTTSGITTSPTGTAHSDLTWAAGTDVNNTEDSTVYFRIKLYDGDDYQADYTTSSAFVVDTKAPVISSATAFSSSPVAGDTSVTLTATWTESNPNTSLFYYALDGTSYGSSTAGTTNTTTPTATISLGTTLNGHSYFDKIKSTATDDYGNVSSESEVLTDVAVTPYIPAQPAVQNATYSSADVIPAKNASEADGLDYCIYISPAIGGNNYIQADGSVGTSAVWQGLTTWGTVTVTGLSYNTTYSLKTKSRNYHVTSTESDFSSTNSITTQKTALETSLKADYAYNASSDTITFNVWIERLGTGLVTSSGDTATINVYNSAGTQVNSSSITSSSPDSRGVWWLTWSSTGLSQNTNYLARISATYAGNTYTTNLTVNITTSKKVSDIATSVGTGLSTTVSAISTSVGTGLATKVDTLQTDVTTLKSDTTTLKTDTTTLKTDTTSIKTAVGASEATTLYSRVASILEDTGTDIPATIVSELKKGPRSAILNRPTTVNSGDTVTIRYRTDSGKTPTVTVYDANNTARISSGGMTEIGSTGVYEYDVAFSSGWGTGDYTIICSETTTNSADSMIINVGTAGGLSSIETKIDTLTTNLSTVSTNVSSIKTIVGTTSDTSASNTLYGKLTGVSSNVSTIKTNWGSYTASDIIGYIDDLEEYLGTPNDASGKQTLFGKIADVYAQTGDIPSTLSVANSAYNEIQDLRKEIDLNGKSDTAYTLLKRIDTAVSEIKDLTAKIPTQVAATQIEEIATSVEETRAALAKAASEVGIKGAVKEEAKKAPTTLNSLQNQIAELRALIEAIKKMMEEKEAPVIKTWLESGSVNLKMIVANPSEDEAKTIPVKTYLPKGATPEDVIDKAGFEIGYDFEKSLYYAYQDLTLGPKETVVLEIKMKDIWVIPDEELLKLKEHTEKLSNLLQKSPHYPQVKILTDNILYRIKKIRDQQSMAATASIEEKISRYETDTVLLKELKRDIGILEDLAIEEGVGLGEEILGESPSTSEAIRAGITGLDVEKLGTVKIRIWASNSSTNKKTVPIKYYLPAEVKAEYIVDAGGLDVAYDYQKGVYYVYKDALELAPMEEKEFIVEIKDVWIIPDSQLQVLKVHTEKLMELLRESAHRDAAFLLGKKVIATLDDIGRLQGEKDVIVERHIANYRAKLNKVDEVKNDIAKMERLAIQAGGSPSVTMAMKTKTAESEEKERGAIQPQPKGMELLAKSIFRGSAPNVTTTWKLIYIIIGFLALISLFFFLVPFAQHRIFMIDTLTAVLNRKAITESLKQEWTLSSKMSRKFSLLMMDIDGFKEINDKYGHSVGDFVLKEFAILMRKGVRPTDSVGRIGGDEFLVILSSADKETALTIAERIKASIANYTIRIKDISLQMTTSIGVVTYPDDAVTTEEMFNKADKAMYGVKGRGGNGIERYV